MIVVRVVRRLVRGTVRGMIHRWPTTLLALALFVGGPLFVWSRGLLPGAPPFPDLPGMDQRGRQPASDMREMTVERVRLTRGGEEIHVILKEKGGNRRLVMGIGPGEALSIDPNLQSRVGNAPVTYDLMRTLVQELGGTVSRVVVNNVTESTFYAKVVMSAHDRQIEVDSRPSDAIALAVRAKAPIFAEASVLDRAGIVGSN